MDVVTIFTIILAIVSIVLAVVSLALSILFYVWSDRSNAAIQQSATRIDHNTQEIQKLFDLFYTDTFGIMKTTILAMQHKIFKNEDSLTPAPLAEGSKEAPEIASVVSTSVSEIGEPETQS